MDLSWITALLDRPLEARELIDQALVTVPDDPYMHYYSGLIRLRDGDEEGALADFEAAIERGYPSSLVAQDPQLERFREDGRFQRMARPGGTR
jgi:regulator of sirC expression with transglutaminase-like and TPR domain